MLRFRYSLRTLFIVVTAICVALGGFIGWQAKIVREREELRSWMKGKQWAILENAANESSLPWYRRMLGDRPLDTVIAFNATADDREKVQAAFPEAKIMGW